MLAALCAGAAQHFWLNEGLCVFLERKILRALKGEKHQHLHVRAATAAVAAAAIARCAPGAEPS